MTNDRTRLTKYPDYINIASVIKGVAMKVCANSMETSSSRLHGNMPARLQCPGALNESTDRPGQGLPKYSAKHSQI